MKNKAINITLIIIAIILTMITIFGIKSYSAFNLQNTEIKTDADLAGYASENPGVVFSLNAKDLVRKQLTPGTSGIYNAPAIKTKAAACLAHWTGNEAASVYTITDILDLNVSGKAGTEGLGQIAITNHYTNGSLSVSYSGENAKTVNRMAYAIYRRYKDGLEKTDPYKGVSRLVIQKLFYNEFYNLSVFRDISEFRFYYNGSNGKAVTNFNDSYYNAAQNIERNKYGNAIEAGANAYANDVANYKKAEFNNNKTNLTTEIVGNNTYIGPISVNYEVMKIANFAVHYDNSGKSVSTTNWAIKNANGTYTDYKIDGTNQKYNGNTTVIDGVNCKDIPKNGEEFYIKVGGSHPIVTRIDLGQFPLIRYIARMILLGEKAGGAQQLAVFVAKYEDNGTYDTILQSTGSIVVKKVDADTNAPLSAGFKLYYQEGNTNKYVKLSGNTISSVNKEDEATTFYTSASTGEIKIKNLNPRTYYIKEVEAPDGYNINLQIKTEESEIVQPGTTKTVEFSNKKYGNLVILKIDKETHEPIENIGFKIKAPDGKYITNYDSTTLPTISTEGEAEIFYTGKDGKIELKNIPTGQYVYEEDINSMKSLGYADEKGEENATTGKIDVIANNTDLSNRYVSIVKNIFNSNCVRERIVQSGWTNKTGVTDVDLVSKIYKSLTGEEYNVQANYNLLVESVMQDNSNIHTLSGENRYGTIVNAAKELYPDGSKVENLVLAYAGDDTTDGNMDTGLEALSSAPLASVLNAPILLTDKDTIPAEIDEEIKRYTNLKNIYIIGESDLISDSVISKLRYRGYYVERISGNNRYDSSINLAKELIGKNSDVKEVIIIQSETKTKDLIDGALISGVAASKKIPIIYVDTGKDKTVKAVENVINNFIKKYTQIETAYLIGDAGKLEQQFEKEELGITIIPVLDEDVKDRYGTNMEIINQFYKNTDGSIKDTIKNVILFEDPRIYNQESSSYISSGVLIDIIGASQLARKSDTLVLLVPKYYDNTQDFIDADNDPGRLLEVKNLITSIANQNINAGKDVKAYTLCNVLIENQIDALLKECKYSKYSGKTLSTLFHSNCIATEDGSAYYVSCQNKDGNGYCYEEYVDKVIQEIAANNIILEGNLKQREDESIEDYEKYISDIYEMIFNITADNDSKVNFDTSAITYYTNQLLGNSIIKIKNTLVGRNLEITKVDKYSKEKLSGVEFKLKYNSVDNEEKYVVINGNNGTTKLSEVKVTKMEPGTASEATIFVTGTDGMIKINNIRYGEYILEETANPYSVYKERASVNITVDLDTERKPIVLEVENTPETKLLIKKVDSQAAKEPLSGVEFKLKYNSGDNIGEYVVINGNKGTTKLSEVKVTKMEPGADTEATIFKTSDQGDKKGLITIENIVPGDYIVEETANPHGAYKEKASVNVTVGVNSNKQEVKVETVTIENTPLVNLIIEKRVNNPEKENEYTSNYLANVKFKLKYNSGDNAEKYVVINGNKGTEELTQVTVTKIESGADTEATIFVTGQDGKIQINEIPVGKYILEEIENNNPAFEAGQSFEIELTSNSTDRIVQISKEIGNKIKYTALSGKVWEDNVANKNDSKNGQYDENVDNLVNGIEVKLYENGKHIATTMTGSNEVKLYKDGNLIKTIKTDSTVGNGEYKFEKGQNGKYLINIEKNEDGSYKNEYYVEFMYDGLTYTSVVSQESKAKEVSGSKDSANTREWLNNKEEFKEINYNSHDTIKGWEWKYENNNNVLTISNQSDKLAVKATTTEANYDLPSNININNYTIEGVNFGITQRNKPDLELDEDLVEAVVSINNQSYLYDYRNISDRSNELENSDVTTKKKQGKTTYTREIYPSDIRNSYDLSDTEKLAVELIYKVTVKNNSKLTVELNSIVNYSDKRCDFIGYSNDNNNYDDKDVKPSTLQKNSNYNELTIPVELQVDQNGSEEVYLKYRVGFDTLIGVLEKDVTLENVSEVSSYTVYENGEIYAGLDRDSMPGNYNINNITEETEDDVAFAHSLQVKSCKETDNRTRTISGIVWEDTDKDTSDDEVKGDGKYSDNEKKVENVKVTLSNGKSTKTTYTDKDGKYTFKEILPGDNYKITFEYGNVGDGEVTKIGDIAVDPMTYKSTTVEEGNYNSKDTNWVNEDENRDRTSDALDIIGNTNGEEKGTRNYVDKQPYTAKEDIYMIAETPIFSIPVEFDASINSQNKDIDAKNDSDTDKTNHNDHSKYSSRTKIDFGIIKRPSRNVEMSKDITNIKLTLSNGQVLIEGNPSIKNPDMKYVKTGLDGYVPIEIDSELLPASLEIEYTITAKNISKIDYDYNSDGAEYYKYGTSSGKEAPQKVQITSIVDYMSKELILNEEKNKVQEDKKLWELKEFSGIVDSLALTNKEIDTSKYNIYVHTFEDNSGIAINESKELKLYASATVTPTQNDSSFENHVEILSYEGRPFIDSSTQKDPTPGNYDPKNSSTTDEIDSDKAITVITKPTGENKDYTMHIILSMSILLIFGLGIVIIKKKVVNK